MRYGQERVVKCLAIVDDATTEAVAIVPFSRCFSEVMQQRAAEVLRLAPAPISRGKEPDDRGCARSVIGTEGAGDERGDDEYGGG